MPIEYRRGSNGCMSPEQANLDRVEQDVLWIDVLSPTDAELEQVDRLLGFEAPNRHDMAEIELSNRLYKEDGALVMIANLLPKAGQKIAPPRPAAFILRSNLLLTIRYSEFYSFERVINKPLLDDEPVPADVFCRLLEEAVADRADNIEFSMRHMEMLTSALFAASPEGKGAYTSKSGELDDALRRIGQMGESVSNIRESITSLQRVVNFAGAHIPDPWMGGRQRGVLSSLASDLLALSDEASFFMNKLSFNLDATLGMINIDEAKIIRLLSVVTLLLSPPMLIAGIYGMNFSVMPELGWPLGYLFAILLMGSTAVGAVWYLKRKRWL